MSYLSAIYFRVMVFLVMGRSEENIEGKKKADMRKTLKSEGEVKRRIRRIAKYEVK